MSLLRKCFDWRSKKVKQDRYKYDCFELSYLANIQLNSEKNRNKGPLEDIDVFELLELCKAEIQEIRNELLESHSCDPTRILEEVGDAAAYLIGVIAWSKKEMRSKGCAL